MNGLQEEQEEAGRSRKRQEEVSWVQPLDVMNSTPSPSLLFPTKLCVSLSKEKNHSQDQEDEEEDEKEGNEAGGWSKGRMRDKVKCLSDTRERFYERLLYFFRLILLLIPAQKFA